MVVGAKLSSIKNAHSSSSDVECIYLFPFHQSLGHQR
jgi:hypothetical protein